MNRLEIETKSWAALRSPAKSFNFWWVKRKLLKGQKAKEPDGWEPPNSGDGSSRGHFNSHSLPIENQPLRSRRSLWESEGTMSGFVLQGHQSDINPFGGGGAASII